MVASRPVQDAGRIFRDKSSARPVVARRLDFIPGGLRKTGTKRPYNHYGFRIRFRGRCAGRGRLMRADQRSPELASRADIIPFDSRVGYFQIASVAFGDKDE